MAYGHQTHCLQHHVTVNQCRDSLGRMNLQCLMFRLQTIPVLHPQICRWLLENKEEESLEKRMKLDIRGWFWIFIELH